MATGMSDYKSMDRSYRIRENEHNLSKLHHEKTQNSSPFYKEARVTTCSKVLVKSG